MTHTYTPADITLLKGFVRNHHNHAMVVNMPASLLRGLLCRLEAAESLIDAMDSYIGEADLPVETKLLYEAWLSTKGEDAP